jgi:hypothetical protein
VTDRNLRELERAAAAGDVEAEARALVARVRAGDLLAERLELAAFAGHEAAVLAGGLESWAHPSVDPRQRPLTAWVSDLGAWSARPGANSRSSLAQVAAALGAAREVLLLMPPWKDVGEVLRRGWAWLDGGQSDAQALAWHRAVRRTAADGLAHYSGEYPWIPRPDVAACRSSCPTAGVRYVPCPGSATSASGRVLAAAREVGEDRARAGAELAVVRWALGRGPP